MPSDAGSGRVLRLRVDDAPGEVRIDAYLARRLPELSRSRVAQLLGEGLILVDGRVPRKSEPPLAGAEVEVHLPPPAPSPLQPEPIPLDIVFEDRDLLVVDKPAGLVVHPAPGHRAGTLVNALLHHVEDLSGIGGTLRPGIVHRLDRDTSGLMLVAKHDRAHRHLSASLKRREIRRVYLAASWGHLREERVEVDAPIARSPRRRREMAVVEGGRPARTRFRRLERWLGADLLEAELDTGRTHQIRVHLAHIGHPVVADTTYGRDWERGVGGTVRSWARELARRVPRQFLHAHRLRFEHPRTAEALEFESPLPEDLERVATWARESSHPDAVPGS